MASAEFWALSQREIRARRKVREGYMAFWRAEVRNAPHFHKSDKSAYTVDDFLARPTLPPAAVEDKNALMFAKLQLGLLKDNPDIVPDWARGPYLGPPKRKVLDG
jgi:hypothetical protein